MGVSLHLQPRSVQVARELEQAVNARGEDLGAAALAIARVEYPALEPARYIELLDRMGREARLRIAGSDPGTERALHAFNEYLYDEQGFSGNRQRYDDPRNSFLNEVLDRRTGIPISLAVVYLEVARRAGLRVSGVNFPGHFLLRACFDMSGARSAGRGAGEGEAPGPPDRAPLMSKQARSRKWPGKFTPLTRSPARRATSR